MTKKIALVLAIILILTACQQPITPSEEPSREINIPTNSENAGEDFVVVESTETLIKYPEYPEDKLPRDYDYSVRIIQGDKAIELPVYNPVYASDYFTRDVYNFDQHRRYTEFAFTGEPVTVEITVHLEFDRYTVMPSSKAIPSEINGNVITYTITEPTTTVLKLNNDKDTHLTIFAEAPETTRPNKDNENVIYFEAGYHEPVGGVLVLTSGTTLYLEPGALVKARVKSGGKDVKICGRGAFIEPNPGRGDYGSLTTGSYMCSFHGANGAVVEDVRFLDAHCYNLVVTKSDNITYDNVKLLCNQVSTDGLSLFSKGSGVHMKNCYFNISDNAFVIGGIYEDFVVEDTIVITDYAFLFPQGNLENMQFTFKNMDVLRYSTFITHEFPKEVGNKSVDLVLENCTAIDSDKAGNFITSTYGDAAVKNYYLKNVSVPKIVDYWSNYIVTTDGTYTGDDVDNVSITFDNVWIGGQPISKKLISGKDSLNYSKNNTVTYMDTTDESKVTIKRNDVILGKWVTPYASYVGNLRIETKYQPYEKDGKIYVSAYEILKALMFKDIKVENGKLTFAYGDKTYEIAVEDEKAMVDTETLAKTVGTGITLMGNRILVTNIKREDNLLRDPDFELGLSMNWVTRNFTKFYLSTDAQSGKYAIRIGEYTWGNESGVYQDIADVVRQHGTGKYRVTAWVKNAKAGTENNHLLIFLSNGWEHIVDSKKFAVTDEWQQVEFVFDQKDVKNLHGGLMLTFGQNCVDKNIIIDNVSMTKLG